MPKRIRLIGMAGLLLVTLLVLGCATDSASRSKSSSSGGGSCPNCAGS